MALEAVNRFALLGDEADGDGIDVIISRLDRQAEEAAAAAAKEALALEEKLKKKNNDKSPRNGSSDDVRGNRKGGDNYPNYGQGYNGQNHEGHSKQNNGRRNGYQQNYDNYSRRDGYKQNFVRRDGYQQNYENHGKRDGNEHVQKNQGGHVQQNQGRRDRYTPKYEGESSQNGVGGYSQGSGRRSSNGGIQVRRPNGGGVFNQGFPKENQSSENVNQGLVSNIGDENAGHEDAQDQGWNAHQFQGANGGGRRRNGNNGGNYVYRAKAGGKSSGNSDAPSASESKEVINGDIAVSVDENGPGTEQSAHAEPQQENKATKEDAKRKAEQDARRKEAEEEAKEEAKKMTLAEYEKLTLEKRKALESLRNEKRKVTLDKDFQSMQIVDKKGEEAQSMKLKSEEKLKRKDSHDKDEKVHEEKARKVLDIKEFLKPSYGGARRSTNGSRGAGAGGRVGFSQDRQNNPRVKIENPSAIEIEDHRQFPSLHAGA